MSETRNEIILLLGGGGDQGLDGLGCRGIVQVLGIEPQGRDQVGCIRRVSKGMNGLDRVLDVDRRRLVERALGLNVVIDNDRDHHHSQTECCRLGPLIGLLLAVVHSVITYSRQRRQTLRDTPADTVLSHKLGRHFRHCLEHWCRIGVEHRDVVGELVLVHRRLEIHLVRQLASGQTATVVGKVVLDLRGLHLERVKLKHKVEQLAQDPCQSLMPLQVLVNIANAQRLQNLWQA